jgi:acetyl-CoA carboxylase biotin carboxyl carrier protein
VSDDPVEQQLASAGRGAAEGLSALTEEVLPALIARLRASRLGELEVRSGSWRVRLRRDPTAAARPRSAHAAGPVDAADETLGSVARSPGVGYFSPAPPLVVGASVLAGDQLGSIDVLGIDQEVYAPADGIVARVLVEDGQAVEYGQALADIDPLGIDIAAEAGLEGDDG